MSDKISLKDAQAEINGLLVAEICRDFYINFRDVYPEHILARGVGPEQAFIGLAIKRGHLALPAVQPDVAAIREAAQVLLIAESLEAWAQCARDGRPIYPSVNGLLLWASTLRIVAQKGVSHE